MGALTNACLNLVKAFLASGVRNDADWLLRFLALAASDFSARIYFLDFAIWLLQLFCTGSFSSRFSTWIPLPSCLSPTAGPAAEAVFSIEVSEAASLLNPWMNHR